MERSEIVRRTWEALEPHLAEQGYELVEIAYVCEGHRATLRLFIDKQGGFTLNDCTAVAQLVSPLLDAADFISSRYYLEVGSPGIDRPLRKPADFERFIGENVKVRAVEPVEGRKKFKGVLTGFRDGLIVLDCGGTICEIHIENLERANLDR